MQFGGEYWRKKGSNRLLNIAIYSLFVDRGVYACLEIGSLAVPFISAVTVSRFRSEYAHGAVQQVMNKLTDRRSTNPSTQN